MIICYNFSVRISREMPPFKASNYNSVRHFQRECKENGRNLITSPDKCKEFRRNLYTNGGIRPAISGGGAPYSPATATLTPYFSRAQAPAAQKIPNKSALPLKKLPYETDKSRSDNDKRLFRRAKESHHGLNSTATAKAFPSQKSISRQSRRRSRQQVLPVHPLFRSSVRRVLHLSPRTANSSTRIRE